MTHSTLSRTARLRRGMAAGAFVLAVPFTMASACQDEGTGDDGEEQEQEEGGMGEGEGSEEDDD